MHTKRKNYATTPPFEVPPPRPCREQVPAEDAADAQGVHGATGQAFAGCVQSVESVTSDTFDKCKSTGGGGGVLHDSTPAGRNLECTLVPGKQAGGGGSCGDFGGAAAAAVQRGPRARRRVRVAVSKVLRAALLVTTCLILLSNVVCGIWIVWPNGKAQLPAGAQAVVQALRQPAGVTAVLVVACLVVEFFAWRQKTLRKEQAMDAQFELAALKEVREKQALDQEAKRAHDKAKH